MKYLTLILFLVGASIAPSFAQNAPADYKTAQAQAIKDPTITQFDQQIEQLNAQLKQLWAKRDEANVKRNIVNEITIGYSSYQWGFMPQQVKDLYQDDANAVDQSAIDDLNKQIAAAKAARTQALWTKIEQIDPALQPVVEQLRKIAAQAAANGQ